jgi:hypothetical protein
LGAADFGRATEAGRLAAAIMTEVVKLLQQ